MQADLHRMNCHFGGVILPCLIFIRIRTYNPIFTSINNICVLLPNGYRCRMWNLWLLTTENVDCWTDKIRRPPSTRFHFGNKHFYSRLWHFKALSFLITYSEEVYTVSEFFLSLTQYRLYSVILLWVKVMPGKIKCPARGIENIACGTPYLATSLISFTFNFI